VPLQRSIEMVARIQGLPERQAKIAPRSEGRVAEIMVKLGDQVTAGQPVLRFEPLTVGNPPVVLKSPIDGYVIRQDANLGQSLTPETVVMEVADYSQVLARGTTFESSDLALIQPGQLARVKLVVFPDEVFEGTVQRFDVGLEPDSRTFETYVLLENPGLKLRPNMQATVILGLGETQDVLAVPQRALLGEMGNLFLLSKTGAPLNVATWCWASARAIKSRSWKGCCRARWW
jgi:multidrug efflux pump subunit AcrA (membrane-fusion protein)